MPDAVRVAVVDYGMGNLFSVRQACAHAGLEARVAASPEQLAGSDAVLLPGVGAFGDAMRTLEERGLAAAIRRSAAEGTPVVGICLGMQLLMEESHEFGRHAGLGLLAGSVLRLDGAREGGQPLKVPQVGWNRLEKPRGRAGDPWAGTPLDGLADGSYAYFVHSYYVKPKDPAVALSTTRYGGIEFCSSLLAGNIFACQHHPERSGPDGLKIYSNLAPFIRRLRKERSHAV